MSEAAVVEVHTREKPRSKSSRKSAPKVEHTVAMKEPEPHAEEDTPEGPEEIPEADAADVDSETNEAEPPDEAVRQGDGEDAKSNSGSPSPSPEPRGNYDCEYSYYDVALEITFRVFGWQRNAERLRSRVSLRIRRETEKERETNLNHQMRMIRQVCHWVVCFYEDLEDLTLAGYFQRRMGRSHKKVRFLTLRHVNVIDFVAQSSYGGAQTFSERYLYASRADPAAQKRRNFPQPHQTFGSTRLS